MGMTDDGCPAAGNGAPGATLRALLAFDDSGALRLLRAPAGHDTPVRRLAVGLDDLGPDGAGTLLLAVGTDAGTARAAGVVREAARGGVRAVVLGGQAGEEGGVHPRALATAEETGVALLVREGGADWGDVVALLRSALSYARAGGTHGDDTPGPDEADSLAALAARTAGRTRGSITVEDTGLHVLAHSATGPDADPLRRTTILGGRVPEWRVAELRRSGLLRALWTSEDVIHRPADDTGNPERLVVAVRSGREVLGSIWAASDGRPLAPDAARHLRTAAGLAAPHLVRRRLRESGTARRREAALRGLLHGTGDRRTHAWALGLSPDTPCAVVLAVRQHADGTGQDRAFDVMALQTAAHRPGAAVLRDGDRLAVLLTFDAPETGQEDAATTAAVLAAARELDALVASLPGAAPVWLGAGPLVASPLDAASSFERAGLVVRALRGREARARAAGPARPARYADAAGVGPSLETLRIVDAARPVWESGSGTVHALVRADLAAGGELVRTLGAWLDCSGDVAAAARRLTVHPNTVRYRLRRMHERYGVDLDDPDTRLLVALAVRLAAE